MWMVLWSNEWAYCLCSVLTIFVVCLSYFSVAVLKYSGTRQKLKEGMVHFRSQFKVQSIIVGKSRQQELWSAGCTLSPVGKKGAMNAFGHLIFSLSYSPRPSPGNSATHTPVNLIKTVSQRHSRSLLSQIILDLIELKIEINHHNVYDQVCHSSFSW